jgi:hypothetical protein
MPDEADSVLAVCKDLFDVERMHDEITKNEQFDGSVCGTADLDGGDVFGVWIVPIERDRQMASLDFIKNMPQSANGDLIDVTASQGDL